MNSGLTTFMRGSARTLLTGVSLALILAACGGGGGSAGTTGGVGAGMTGGTTGGTTGTTPTPAAVAPTLTLSLIDGTNAPVTSLSGGQTGVVRALFKDGKGAPLANAVVKFTVSDTTLVQFTPISASALTDSTGLATINLKPADFSSAGAVTITAQAALDAQSGSATINIGVGAAPLVVGALSFTPAPSASLAALSSITLNVPVTSNGQPVSSAPGLTLNSLCLNAGTATITPGPVTNGVATATYLNKGCTLVTDTITASIGTSSQSIALAVSSANIGTINFVSANPSGSSLVLKGSGGLGRTESALLTFKVVDQAGNPLSAVRVDFIPTTTTGGLQVLPTFASTDSNGNVQTSVQAGTIPTPVRVTARATAQNGSTISGLSDALTISTGLPIQKSMSISTDSYNIEGLDYDGVKANITLRMADQYGNPVSDGATINFVTEGGAVGSSLQGACQTVNGGCTVPLISQSFRPANGRVTVLAYTQGLPDFTDSNGDGQYSCTNFTSGDNTTPTTFRPLIDTCNSGAEPFVRLPDAYLDTGSHLVLKRASQVYPPSATNVTNVTDLGVDGVAGLPGARGFPLDGSYDAAAGDQPIPFGHPVYSSTPSTTFGVTYIRRSIEITFSGSSANLIRVDPVTLLDYANYNDRLITGLGGASGCTAKTVSFRLADVNNNPLPAGTTIAVADVAKVTPGTLLPSTVLSTSSIGGTVHTVVVQPESTCASGGFTILVTTPKGIVTGFPFTTN